MHDTAAAPEPISRVLWVTLGWWLLALLAVLIAHLGGLILIAAKLVPWPVAEGAVALLGSGAAALVLLHAARRGLQALPPTRPEQPLSHAELALAILACAGLGAFGTVVRAGGVARGHDTFTQGMAVGIEWAIVSAASPLLAALVALVSFGVAAVLVPLCEELFFRGWIWLRLEAHGALLAGLATGAFWVALHAGGAAGILALLPLAALLAWVRYRTASPRTGILLHGAFNAGVLLGGGLVGILR